MPIKILDKNNQRVSTQKPISNLQKINAFAWAINKFVQHTIFKKKNTAILEDFHTFNLKYLTDFFSHQALDKFQIILKSTLKEHPYQQNSIEHILVIFINAVGASEQIVELKGIKGINSPLTFHASLQSTTQNPSSTLDEIIIKHKSLKSDPKQYRYFLHSFIRDVIKKDVSNFENLQFWLTQNIKNPANISKVIDFFIHSINSLRQKNPYTIILVHSQHLDIFEQTVQYLQSQNNYNLLSIAERLDLHLQAYKNDAKNYLQHLTKKQSIMLTNIIKDLHEGFIKYQNIADPQQKITAICDNLLHKYDPQYWISSHEDHQDYDYTPLSYIDRLGAILNSNKILHSGYAINGFAAHLTELHTELQTGKSLTECSDLIQLISANTRYTIYDMHNTLIDQVRQTSVMQELIEHFAPKFKQELLTPSTAKVRKRIKMGSQI